MCQFKGLFLVLFGTFISFVFSNGESTTAAVDGGVFLISESRIPSKTCQLHRNDHIFKFTVGENTSFRLPTGETIYPMEYKNPALCGFRVFNVTQGHSEGEWTLSGVDKWDNGFKETTTLVFPNVTRKFTLENDQFSWKVGTLAVERVTKNEPQICQVPFVTSAGSTVLGVDFNLDNSTTVCSIEHVPSGRRYEIGNGKIYGRYSAYKTRLESSLCQFEIPAAEDATDGGLWKITSSMTYTDDFATITKNQTCHFYVSSSMKTENSVQGSPARKVIKTMDDTVTINCATEMDYPIEMCYLFIKQGMTMTTINTPNHCEFVVPAGNWTCRFNGRTAEEDDVQQHFEVIQYDTAIIDGAVTRTQEGKLRMECHYIRNVPIQHCLFVSPEGKIFRPRKNTVKGSSYSAGAELSTGECSIEFSQEVKVDRGDWTCNIITMEGEKLRLTVNQCL